MQGSNTGFISAQEKVKGRTHGSLARRLLLRFAIVLGGIFLLGMVDALTNYLGSSTLNPTSTTSPLPGLTLIGLYLVYMLLMLAQPRLAAWSRWRITSIYLLTVFALTLMVGFFASPLLQFLGFVAICGVVFQARRAFGRSGSWLVGGVFALTILLDLLVINRLAAATLTQWSPLQVGMWLIGLALVQTFTALSVQERTTRQRNETLVQELLLAQAQLRTYALNASETAMLQERARIAREMHDTLAQGLAAIKMHLETGQAVFERDPQQARAHMAQALRLAGAHLHDTRTSILELRSEALHNEHLLEALAALASNASSTEQQLTFQASIDSQLVTELAPMAELALYRVAQEAVSNAIRHAHATHIALELSLEGEELCLTVTDDGCGFDPAALQARQGFGLVGMHERMRLLAGRLEAISSPGAGTQIVAMLPLEQRVKQVSL